MNETKFLTLDHTERICFEYAKSKLAHDEPIPPFGSRFPNKLESALASPQRVFGGKFLYPTLERQAAVLFYELAKLHPFQNGNKRIATVALLVFISLNNSWLKTSWRELYDIAVLVAASDSQNRDGMISLLDEFIKNKLVKE